MGGPRNAFSRHKENKMHWEQGSVYDLSWSSDGSLLTAAGSKGPVRSWRLERGGHKEGEEHKGIGGNIERLAWCPGTADTNILAAAAFEKTVYLWDQRTGAVQTELNTKKANSDISWSHSGKYFLSASRDEGLEIFDMAQPQSAVVSAGVDGLLNSARWSIDDKLLLLTTHSGTVEVFSWPQMEHLTVIPAHAASCNCLGIDPLGRMLVTGSADATVGFWNMNDFSLARTVDGFESPLLYTEFNSDGQYVACASDDLDIKIFSVLSGDLVHKLAVDLLTTTLAWHPRNLAFAYGSTSFNKTGKKPAVTIFL
ncbi:hypothetical protein IWW36_003152 [Coemansia brasiliensis]|uniref:Uncharacterized protein n=1 Tax=Coemansia brasiliensis TaxID=2650707 RepID=A0A9W8LXH1_9FUNG|nr:hypothetical protein IWW36_003152 [Coemansia brasiliensis]